MFVAEVVGPPEQIDGIACGFAGHAGGCDHVCIGLHAVGRSLRLCVGAALAKGSLKTLFVFGIMMEASMNFVHGTSPFVLLVRHRKGGINLCVT
jgi:hypothetical protein